MAALVKPNRCPNCGKEVDVASLAYSIGLRAFVCAECRGEKPGSDDPLDQLAASASAPGEAYTPPKPPPQRSRHGLPRQWIAGLVIAAACITAIALFLVARTKPALSDERAWEAANRDKIIALKSEAEGLVIDNKLREAHAKYRELEKLLGGRTIQEPRLFDLVDQARLDQSRVYTMIMHSMDPQVVMPNAGLPPQIAPKSTPASEPAYPPEFARLQVDRKAVAPAAAAPQLIEPAPATTQAAAEAATVPATSQEVTEAPPSTTVAATSAPARRQEPEIAPVRGGPVRVTDADVEESIRRGANFLIEHFDANGELRRGPDEGEVEHEGLDALAVYALLQASKAVVDPRLGIKGDFLPKCIDRLKKFKFEARGEIQAPITYSRSLRASALATYNRPQDREVLQADVKWLIHAAVKGAYTYDDSLSVQQSRGPDEEMDSHLVPRSVRTARLQARRGGSGPRIILTHNGEVMPTPSQPMLPLMPPGIGSQLAHPFYRNELGNRRYEPPKVEYKFPWDNSNSQYGLLGVWAGAEVGVEVPDSYWKAVQKHWVDCQVPSGQWTYIPNFDPSYSMTVGGVASLLITHDYLEAPLMGKNALARQGYSDSLNAGLAFLEDGDNVIDIMQTPRDAMMLVGYNLFGLERVGLASGLKYFGAHDWFRELTTKMLPFQRASGSWGRTADGKFALIDTSYVLLFLARGRHPILMNKLRYEGNWANRPRDLANLASFASREMERPVNWQVVDIGRSPDDWADAPILYVTGNKLPQISGDDLAKLKTFIDDGGLLFTQPDINAEAFNGWAAQLAKRMYPNYPLKELPATHPIYSLSFNIPMPRPRLLGISNGSRLLMLHAPTDLAGAWQTRASVSRKEIFQLGVNMYLYTTGKERFRNRLDTRAVPYPPGGVAPQIDAAQLQYDGNWNPEPGAWPRFAKKFQNDTGIRVVVHSAKPAELDATKYLFALLTGTDGRIPTDADLAPTRKFLNDGGTLLVEACGGSGEFAGAIDPWLTKLLGDAKLQPLAADDPLFKQTKNGTVDLPSKSLRLYAMEQLKTDTPRLKSAKVGKGRVVFSALDVRSGLLGTNTWGVLGYLPEYSEALMKNFVLVTSAGN